MNVTLTGERKRSSYYNFFGAVTGIETGPNGNLLVVSLMQETICEIFPR